MTTYIKVMSHQNLPDTDPSKSYAMYTVGDGDTFRFALRQYERSGSSSKENCLEILRFVDRDKFVEPPATAWETIPLLGNAYVMNDAGKTIGVQEPFKLATHVKDFEVHKGAADNAPFLTENQKASDKEQSKILRGVVASLAQLSRENIIAALGVAASGMDDVGDAIHHIQLASMESPGKITRERLLHGVMRNGRIGSDELFRQTGRSNLMLSAAKTAATTHPVVVVVKDESMKKVFIERLGKDAAGITVISYNPSKPEQIDWNKLQVMGDFIHHKTFIDHDVLFIKFKDVFREYWKYEPNILVKGNVFRLDPSDRS